MRTGGSVDSPELPEALSVIGEDLTITGTMTSKGEIQIEGQVQGDITCSSVPISDSGTVHGVVLADQVHVRGSVNGAVYGKKLTLRSSSHIDGDIHYCLLSIEEGAQFDGLSRSLENPKALVQAAREAQWSSATAHFRTANKSLGGKRPAASRFHLNGYLV